MDGGWAMEGGETQLKAGFVVVSFATSVIFAMSLLFAKRGLLRWENGTFPGGTINHQAVPELRNL